MHFSRGREHLRPEWFVFLVTRDWLCLLGERVSPSQGVSAGDLPTCTREESASLSHFLPKCGKRPFHCPLHNSHHRGFAVCVVTSKDGELITPQSSKHILFLMPPVVGKLFFT